MFSPHWRGKGGTDGTEFQANSKQKKKKSLIITLNILALQWVILSIHDQLSSSVVQKQYESQSNGSGGR